MIQTLKIEDNDASGGAGEEGLFGATGNWLQAKSSMVVEIAECKFMVPGRNYSFSFIVKNGLTIQDSPADMHIEVSAAAITGGYTVGDSQSFIATKPLAPDWDPTWRVVPDSSGRHNKDSSGAQGLLSKPRPGGSCYDSGGVCKSVRLATMVYVDKPKGVPDGRHQPLLIVWPGQFHNVLLSFKGPSGAVASSQAGQTSAQIEFDFELGEVDANRRALNGTGYWVDIHNNTMGNYTRLRSKRYIWLKFPTTIIPSASSVSFTVTGMEANSALSATPYSGVAKCSTGMLSITDEIDDPAKEYDCSAGYQSAQDENYWKLLVVIDPVKRRSNGDPELDTAGNPVLANGAEMVDGVPMFTARTYTALQLKLTGLAYSRRGVSVDNSNTSFGYFSIPEDCRDGVVKHNLASTLEKDWWIGIQESASSGYRPTDGVGSVYPTTVDYSQKQKTAAGATITRARVLDWFGPNVADAATPPSVFSRERGYSDVVLTFHVNHKWLSGESIEFTLGDSTQGIACTATSKTDGIWTVTVSGTKATVKVSQNKMPLNNAGIAAPEKVEITLDAATFKCRLPDNGIDPIGGVKGAEGAMSVGVFRVKSTNGNTGRSTPDSPVDNRHPVYKFKCLQIDIKTTGAEYCNAQYQMSMCAVNTQAITTYVAQSGLDSAGGFGVLMQGGASPTGNGTLSAVAASGLRAQMKARCDAAHDSACGADFGTTTARLDLLSAEAISSICCSHSPETHLKTEVGIGNLATCLQDYDCDGIPAGEVLGTAAVAKAEEVCCNYCYDFYGSVACVDAQGQSPGTDNAYVQQYCKTTIGCVDMPPCKGYSFGGKGVTVPASLAPGETLTVATLGGDGVSQACEHRLSVAPCGSAARLRFCR